MQLRAAALALGALVWSRTGVAQEPAPRAAMDQQIISYYGGEATSAYVIMGLGLACVAAGVPLVAQNADFARGLGVPLLSLGALEGIGALFYAFQVQSEIAHYRGLLTADPQAFHDAEIAHIAGTRSRFIIYRSVELALALAGAGIATYGFVANQDLYKGIGVGLFAIGVPFLIIDTVNNGRAAGYYEHLMHFDPALSVQGDAHGWKLALGGRF